MNREAAEVLITTLNPSLRMAAWAFLPRTAHACSYQELQDCWYGSPEGLEHILEALVSADVFIRDAQGHYSMADPVREALLIALINAGAIDEARSVILAWRTYASQVGDLLLMATTHEHLSNLLMLTGQLSGCIAENYCALSLRQAAGDFIGVAHTSWVLGALYANNGLYCQALPLLSRATILAEEFELPQASRYRQRLREVQGLLDEAAPI